MIRICLIFAFGVCIGVSATVACLFLDKNLTLKQIAIDNAIFVAALLTIGAYFDAL